MMTDHRVFYRRHLPHWQPEGATLFVTLRLAGSLPRVVIDILKERLEQEKSALSSIDNLEERQKRAYLDGLCAFRRWDAALDVSDSGSRWLAQQQVADVVVEALHYCHKRVYDLLAFCIMPNHVHLVCTPLQCEDNMCYPLKRIMQSLKRHTARQANKVLERQGAFWQAESYDHVVRDADELVRIVQYVINNPVKGGLVSDWEAWPWTYVNW
jgi:REP element-mobilizing transposase RayT